MLNGTIQASLAPVRHSLEFISDFNHFFNQSLSSISNIEYDDLLRYGIKHNRRTI